MAVSTPLLDTIDVPADLRKLDSSQLRQVADELRSETIDAASESGGHFGAVAKLPAALQPGPRRWTHLGLVSSPDEIVVYVQGFKLGSWAGSYLRLQPGPLEIGRPADGSRPGFRGWVDELRVVSGDRDPDDDLDSGFRQTGLQDNDARLATPARIRLYGELLDPEFSKEGVDHGGIVVLSGEHDTHLVASLATGQRNRSDLDDLGPGPGKERELHPAS